MVYCETLALFPLVTYALLPLRTSAIDSVAGQARHAGGNLRVPFLWVAIQPH